ncbi:MAG: ABC transporter permease [Patescibacteria group bacterium]|jgi:lipopolysaccharide transport system permease protein|nr:ABC transporter permease [Patescibacteria group bacterium]
MEKITIIKPRTAFDFSDLKEIWEYRELLYFFTWRDLKVRYKQTVIGVAWAIFQPLMTMIIFSIFFGKFAQMPSDDIPYPIFVYVGLLLWQFFSGSVTEISNSLINNKDIITKVYFPRIILPISATITKFIDFLIASVILIFLMIYYGYLPHLSGFLILPLLLLITFIAALGLGLFLAALNVKYRDVRYILPFFIQIMLFLTPVIYPASITGIWSWFLAMNPMTGVIKAARAALLGNFPINWPLLGISTMACLILLAVGYYYFRKTEEFFADIV